MQTVEIDLTKETIEYKGNEINVVWIRDCVSSLYCTNIEERVKQEILKRIRHIDRVDRRFNINDGFRLKFYTTERKMFPKENLLKLDDKLAEKILKKLARHFKVKISNIRFYGNRGSVAYFDNSIRLSHNPTLLVIIHELAHRFNDQKYNMKGHNKKLLKTITKIIKYWRKKYLGKH